MKLKDNATGVIWEVDYIVATGPSGQVDQFYSGYELVDDSGADGLGWVKDILRIHTATIDKHNITLDCHNRTFEQILNRLSKLESTTGNLK
jgi:hypothetical protein